MKTSKMILSALVAMVALVSCNKQETSPDDFNYELKTVKISLEGLTFTKAETAEFVTNETAVNLTSFKIFLTDGQSLLKAASDGTNEPVYYYSVAAGEALPKSVTVHYVPSAVNKVVVVGNVDETWGDSFTTYSALKAAQLNLEDEQNVEDLTLFGESTLSAAGTAEDHDNGKTYNVYSASVKLAPLVARFEVDGFAMTFNSDPAKFVKVEVKQLALDNYYATTTLSPLAPASLTTKVTEVNDASVFKYFTDNLSVTGNLSWYYDALPASDVVLDKADATGTPLVAVDDMATKKSYHFFPSTEIPRFYIQLATYVDGEAVALPSYIYSKGFKTSTGEEVTFAPGYVYRMNFKGTANNGDGDLPFEEEDINQLDKCLEITVDVIDWAVVSIYPEF